MIRTVAMLPHAWKIVAFVLVILGAIATITFLVRYMTKLPWYRRVEGRHIVSWTANVAGFMLIFVVQIFIPDWSWRPYLVLFLLAVLVTNCWWREVMLEVHLWQRKRTARAMLRADSKEAEDDHGS